MSIFYDSSQTSFNPVAMNSGTELFAQFLHGLILMRKPQRILEYGAGYTTSQILRSLEKLREEHRGLQKIVQGYLAQIRAAMDPKDVVSMHNANIVSRILQKQHYHYNLQHFLEDYEPDYVIIEDAGTEYYLKELKRLVAETTIKVQLKFLKYTELEDKGMFDLIINDSDDYFDFCVKYWDQLSEGGSLIYHQCYENFRKDHDQIMEYLKSKGAQFTFFNIQEPNKHMQNGCFVYQKLDLNSTKNTKDCLDENVGALLEYIRDHPEK
jgi:hypothetical protein